MGFDKPTRRFRSRDWFDDPARMDMVALCLERYMNDGFTPEEFRFGS
jgi:dihydroxy-acid dehydratase